MHMNSYLKWPYELIVYMTMSLYDYTCNEYMNSWLYEFICINSKIVSEFRSIWIQICEIKISNLNSWIWFHKYEFVIRIHCWKSRDNSIFWIHSNLVNMLYEFVSWIHKNHTTDFCNEIIYGLNFYEFLYLKSQYNLWLHIEEKKALRNSSI